MKIPLNSFCHTNSIIAAWYSWQVLLVTEEREVSISAWRCSSFSRFQPFYVLICVQTAVMKAVQCASFVPKCAVETRLFKSVIFKFPDMQEHVPTKSEIPAWLFFGKTFHAQEYCSLLYGDQSTYRMSPAF